MPNTSFIALINERLGFLLKCMISESFVSVVLSNFASSFCFSFFSYIFNSIYPCTVCGIGIVKFASSYAFTIPVYFSSDAFCLGESWLKPSLCVVISNSTSIFFSAKAYSFLVIPAFILNGFAILLIIIDYTKLSKTKLIYPLQNLLMKKLRSIGCLPEKCKSCYPRLHWRIPACKLLFIVFLKIFFDN